MNWTLWGWPIVLAVLTTADLVARVPEGTSAPVVTVMETTEFEMAEAVAVHSGAEDEP